jgi:Ca2+/Na+ antiporter
MMPSTSASLGLSTVIGSGCFDFTICLGISAFTAYYYHSSLQLDLSEFYVIYLWYLAGLVTLIGVTADGSVSLVEACGILVLTPAYLYYNFTTHNKPSQSYQDLEVDISKTGATHLSVPGLEMLSRAVHWFFKQIIPEYTGFMWQILTALTAAVLASFVITKLTVVLLERVLCHLSLPESLVGLTILAWGNNIGDIMNSAAAARRGNGQLSVSSVISTQVLNIHCSLGLPWVLGVLQRGVVDVEDTLTMNSLLFVMGVVVVSILVIILGGKALNLTTATMLTGLYCAYIVCELTVLQGTRLLE